MDSMLVIFRSPLQSHPSLSSLSVRSERTKVLCADLVPSVFVFRVPPSISKPAALDTHQSSSANTTRYRPRPLRPTLVQFRELAPATQGDILPLQDARGRALNTCRIAVHTFCTPPWRIRCRWASNSQKTSLVSRFDHSKFEHGL